MSRIDLPYDYYIWLCDVINLRAHRGYSKLIKQLSEIEFYWSVANDGDRAEDGKRLRIDYIFDTDDRSDDSWVDEPCSVLEMLIALASRLRNDIMPEYDIETDDWFWKFISNLGLDLYNDRNWSKIEVGERVNSFLSRDGKVVLFFSEKHTKKQHKKLEIWYQMHFWLAENYEF